jgi:uncharacterized phage protein gp47/JayE
MTLACTINENGITAPTYQQIYDDLVAGYTDIFGSEAYLDADSQDGQLLGIFALALADINAATINAYNSYSPTFAVGNGLSNQVKINGIRRLLPSKSTANVLIVGTFGTIILNGIVSDTNSHQWDLPASVSIPISGSITVQVMARDEGAINAAIGAINKIDTPTLGWQSVISTSTAIHGNPVETDNLLRIRQQRSVSLPAISTIDSINAALLNLTGVLDAVVYENNTNTTQGGTSITPHSISAVVKGGDPQQIAQTIADSKAAGGTNTFGNDSAIVFAGNHPITIRFWYALAQPVTATIYITPLSGYSNAIGEQARQALFNYINGLKIGHSIFQSNIIASVVNPYFNLLDIGVGINALPEQLLDIAIPYNGYSSVLLSDITLTIM